MATQLDLSDVDYYDATWGIKDTVGSGVQSKQHTGARVERKGQRFTKVIDETIAEVKNVVFLDIDGVLFDHERYFFPKALSRFGTDDPEEPQVRQLRKEFVDLKLFESRALANLTWLINELKGDVGIVISSSWRAHGIDWLQRILKVYAIFEKIIDVTCDKKPEGASEDDNEWRSKYRPWQIQQWLDLHPTVTNYVIIDDIDDGLSKFGKRFIHVDGKEFLTKQNVIDAKDALGVRNNSQNTRKVMCTIL